jgi:hypothetical protein
VLAACDARRRESFARRIGHYRFKALTWQLRQGASYDKAQPVLALPPKFVILPRAANALRPLSSFRQRHAAGRAAEINPA